MAYLMTARRLILMGHINHTDCVWRVQNRLPVEDIMYSQPRIGHPSLSVFIHDELFTFKSLQFVFAVEIFKWVTSPNIHFVQKGHLPL
jgi:hypothetical protein